MALEEPAYDVLMTRGDVEVRRYEPYIVAEVTTAGQDADRQAFNILAGYIFGDNAVGEKMNMTAPVETRGQEYAFVMEKKYSLDTLPAPNDDRVRLGVRPARVVAVKRFSGRWTQSNVDRNAQALLDELETLGIAVTGPTELARYNSPFTPAFLRRNEIIVPVDWSHADAAARIATGAPPRL